MDKDEKKSSRIAVQSTYPIDSQGRCHKMFLYYNSIQNENLECAENFGRLHLIALETTMKTSGAASCSSALNKLQR